jgi:dTDP-3-amino-2,3,6-trideoxy-4-keto-D-glucose/dTDP-3-amino-3,4,6-trideoxy-alpha-D-glucose/dTDP-2,6-dideoxy-D-kanosamine transaminase
MLLINDIKRQNHALERELNEAIHRVLARGWYILGPEVEAFEHEFAAYCGTKACIGVGNGTDALEIALASLEVAPGAPVATVANAGMYSTTAILRAGARPLFIDVCENTMTMDPAHLRASLTRDIAAIIVTHLYGRMAAIGEIRAIAGAAGIPLIEDCAQAHGAEVDGGRAGSWGAIGCFSFYPTKNLGALGDGGCLVTKDLALAGKIRSLRQYGWTERYRSRYRGGRNSRLDEIQAAILRTKLPHLDAWNERRRQIARAYGATAVDRSYVAHLYVVRTDGRDELRAHLAAAGIAADIHYPIPDYRQESIDGDIELPVAEHCCNTVLTLPCFPEMTDSEVAEVVTQTIVATTRSQIANPLRANSGD